MPPSEDAFDKAILAFEEKSFEIGKLFSESKWELQRLRNYTVEEFFKEQECKEIKNEANSD